MCRLLFCIRCKQKHCLYKNKQCQYFNNLRVLFVFCFARLFSGSIITLLHKYKKLCIFSQQDVPCLPLKPRGLTQLFQLNASAHPSELFFMDTISHETVNHSSSSSASHKAEQVSLAIRRSPLGDRHTVPTLGPSGRQLRLNCCEKNLRKKFFSHFSIVSLS